jgi:acyl-CoA synthetase (AMP-forming)/AMP-acid ligase II
MKAALVPVNTNYRYRHDELHYLWDNADAAAVVFHGEFTETAGAVRPRCPRVRLWLHVDDGTTPCPDWAVPYEQAAAAAPAPSPRSGDDPVFIYTGGTTGRPKGVIWRQHDLYLASNTTSDPPEADLTHVRARIAAAPAKPIGLPAAPLMHGTGFVFAATILNRGGTVVTLPERRFDPARLLDTIVAERVSDICIVGDAFCLPIVDALDAEPGRWDLSSLKVMSSSGMMWSSEVKRRLLAHAPELLMIDFLNSSEASGMGRSITSKRSAGEGARFQLGKNAFVIDSAGTPLRPGSGEVGRVAVRGHVPIGYYKDPERSAATFPVVDGVRCAVPGDYATVEADGTIKLLGRGSVSINTGGEKVFPEEVEEAIKTHPLARDAIVIGVPDPRFGQVVAAAVEPAAGATLSAAAIVEHVRARLANHKIPRHVMIVGSIERAATGKADYREIQQRMSAWLAQGVRSDEEKGQ